MYEEIFGTIPLLTGLDIFVEQDIEELYSCISNCEIQGETELCNHYKDQLQQLYARKLELDGMSKFKRWWHCNLQYYKDQHEYQKVVNEHNKHLRRLGVYM